MNSCLYEGPVWHRRATPVVHDFTTGVFMVYLDLAELPDVFRRRWLWSTSRPAPFRFRREDHLGDARRPLAQCVRDLVGERTGRALRGPIRLLTNLRHFGYGFTPVSFFYCFDETGERLEAVVAEVSNTPWNERHCYVLELGGSASSGGFLRAEQPKEFHVSPFMEMDATYKFSFATPGETLTVHIDSERRGAPFFQAGMTLKRAPITGRALARVALTRPLMTAKVISVIHWQALRLWCKGAPYVPHPGRVIPAPARRDSGR